MKKIFVIKYREGRNEGEIWGVSLDKNVLIKAIATENRDNEYFKNHTDQQIWETIQKSGEFEMITAKYF